MKHLTEPAGNFSSAYQTSLELLCLALVALIYAGPLVTHLTTAMPGGPDDLDVATFVWNVWWTHYALDTGRPVFGTDMVLLPFGADLRLHTYGLLQALIAFPFTHVLGDLGAFNLVMLLTLFLNGTATYTLVRRETGQSQAALIAAVWFMLGLPVLIHLQVGRPSFASLWIVASALLALRSLLRQPGVVNATALGVCLVAALLTDFQIVLFMGLWLVVYGGWGMVRLGQRRWEPKRWLALGWAAALFLVPFGVWFYPVLAGAGPSGFPRPSLDDMRPYSFRWWDYLTPGGIPLAFGYEFLVGTAATVIGLRRHTGYRVWLLGAVVCLVLALGPYLEPTRMPLPFALTSLWPPLGQFRTPGRLTMPALLGLSVVVGYGLAAGLRHLASARWRVALVTLAVGGRLALAIWLTPMPIQTYPAYATYAHIATEPGDFVLLEVPFGVRSGLARIGNGGEALQYYQLVHGKRLLNGMVARLPQSVFDFYRAHPSLVFLSGETVRIDNAALDQDFAEVLAWSNTRYVVVHRRWLTADQAATILDYLERHPRLRRVSEEQDLVLFRVD